MIIPSRWTVSAVALCVAAAGCTSAGVESNFNRVSERTALLSTADLRQASDLSGVTGTATYDGIAAVNLPAPSAPIIYPATADVRLVADFDNASISGNLTNWTDMMPLSYELRGSAAIFGGVIDPDAGEFTASITGNVERRPIGAYNPLDPPVNYVFDGFADGAFHDSVDGDPHSHVVGRIIAPLLNGGLVTGDYVARR